MTSSTRAVWVDLSVLFPAPAPVARSASGSDDPPPIPAPTAGGAWVQPSTLVTSGRVLGELHWWERTSQGGWAGRVSFSIPTSAHPDLSERHQSSCLVPAEALGSADDVEPADTKSTGRQSTQRSGTEGDIVKVRAVDVPAGKGKDFEYRFSLSMPAMDGIPGFRGFELLRPTAGGDRYFVYTRWVDEEAYQAWVGSGAWTQVAQLAHSGENAAPASSGGNLLEFDVVLAHPGSS